MKVILHEEVPDVGHVGDLVTVADGFARNYLIPRKLAVQADTKNVRTLDHQKRQVDRRKARLSKDASDLAQKLETVSCTIPVLVGEQDKLFGSVTTRDIEEALRAEGLNISRRQIELPEPIKTLGVYTVDVRLHQEIKGKIKVWVVAK